MDAIVTSFAFTAVSIAASNLIQTRCCFKEGTLVETEEGLKPIEEIEVGDKVLAYDEETGEQAYKPVVQLFRNETKEWYHVQVNGEEIVCTGGHPFYVLNAAEERQKVNYEGQTEGTRGAWICANQLQVGDEVLLSDGSVSAIGDVQLETLTAPETTYNFEVADFHTYYVSDSKVLVHNKCTPNNSKVYSPEEIAERYNITVEQFHKQVKPEILRRVKPNYKVGKNPDIALNKVGDIAYQGAKGSKFAQGFQDTGLNILDIIKDLGLGG